MTTVIKASNFNFTNIDLPVLHPTVTDGLVAMFRPTSGVNGLADISLNNHTLTKVGNPALSDVSASGNNANSFQTSIPETQSITIIAVLKSIEGTSNGVVFGNYKNKAGVSVWYSFNSAKDKMNVQWQVHSKQADGTYKNNQIIVNTFSAPFHHPWQFMALTIDAENGIATAYNPSNQKEIVLAGDFANRALSDNFRIFNSVEATFPGSSELAEVIVFDKALSKQQIMQQYEYSKSFMQKHRGIVI